jgi:GDPmannose 4,6-dehydratase
MASSSEIFGEPSEWPQTETTSVQPRSPYGAAKAFAYWMTSSYRQVHSVWAASAILYNHESPLRSEEFVTRKITRGVAAIVAGKATELRLGNLEARRDWGHASDYVEAMWRMLQCEAAEDFIIGSGESHSVREFCELAFSTAGLDYRDHVVQDERLFRPADAFTRVADSSLAAQKLNWRPTYTFEALVREMTRADLARVNRPAG